MPHTCEAVGLKAIRRNTFVLLTCCHVDRPLIESVKYANIHATKLYQVETFPTSASPETHQHAR